MNLKSTSHPLLRKAFSPSRLAFYALVLLLLYAAILPFFAGTDLHEADLSQARLAPSAAHWFGTDLAGHDLLVRVALGLRVSIFVAAVCAVVSTVIGVLIGAVAASWGGKVDSLLMRFTDTINALPQLLLGIAIVAFYPGSLVAIIASIALVHWSPVARIVRSIALSTRELEYVEAAYLAGASHWQVARKHLLPSVFGQMKVSVVLLFPHAIWHESTLSFLGLGISPDKPSLGTLLEVARTEILIGCWWELVFPAGALVSLTLLIFGWASGLGKASRGAAGEADSAESDTLVGDLSVAACDVARCVHEAPAGEPDENTAPPALEFQDLSVTIPRSGWISDQRIHDSLTDTTAAKPTSTAKSPTECDLVLEDHVNLQVRPGELHALLGQSGAGKSILAKTATGMLPGKMQVSGQVSVGGIKLYGKHCPWPAIRGHLIAVASQSSATAFAPNRTIGDQLEEAVKLLQRRDWAELLSGQTAEGSASSEVKDSTSAWGSTPLRTAQVSPRGEADEPTTVTELCEMTGFPTDSLAAYPHELSGGMLTRANLALALAAQGLKVGVLDADIYGFSIPRMLGVVEEPTVIDGMIVPPVAAGVKVISIGMFVPEGQPVVWRGPMLHRALQQFLADVYWGDLDVLLLDLPPGTGDVAISISQLLPGSEILVVTTPQVAAAEVAERAGVIGEQTERNSAQQHADISDSRDHAALRAA